MKRRPQVRKRVRIQSVLGAVLCMLFGVMLICNLVIIVKGTLNPQMPPSIFGITPMVVMSGSMSGGQEGHIETGDLIFAAQTEPQTLAVGDVITYMSDGVAVTHRITSIQTAEDGNLLFTTKGDANDTEDTESVSPEQLVGVYRGRIPKVGDFVLFMQKPMGMLLFIGVPLFAFILYDVIRRQRYARLEQKRAQEMEEELARLRAMARQNRQIPSDTQQ